MTATCAPPPMPTRDGYSVANAHAFGWASLSNSLPEERLKVIEENLCGPRILDAGCGGGGYVDYFARKGFDAVGLDKYEMFLDLARERGLHGQFVQASLEERLPFEDKEFDTTLCLDVLEHISDHDALGELARVTKRRVILAVPAADERPARYGTTYYPYLDQTHLRYYTRQSVIDLAETVRPHTVRVFPGSRVPVESLVLREMRVQSRWPLLTAVYNSLFRFLLRRAKGPAWHSDWMAVIDLVPSAG